jgi:hypothetical protein
MGHITDLDATAPAGNEDANLTDDYLRALHLALLTDINNFTGAAFSYGEDASSTVTYAYTPNATIGSYIKGLQVVLKVGAANTTATPSLNIFSLGAKTIKRLNGTALVAGDLAIGYNVLLYDGTNFLLLQSPALNIYRNVANVFTKTQTWSKGADVASATALPVLSDGNYFDVTGTTDIETIDSLGVGTIIGLHHDGILDLVHSADLFLPGAANIPTAAGDESLWIEHASGDWRCLSYQRAASIPFNAATVTAEIALLKELFHYTEEYASGTAWSTYTATTWNTVVLNTLRTNSVSGASISSNVVTLGAGTYDVRGRVAVAPTNTGSQTTFKTRLRQTSGTPATLLVGMNQISNAYISIDNPSVSHSPVAGRITLAGSTDIELQLYPSKTTGASPGALTSGENELFAELEIRRVSS